MFQHSSPCKRHLGGHQSINDLILPGGRLKQQRDTRMAITNSDSGRKLRQTARRDLHVPKTRPSVYKIDDDVALIMDILEQEQILLVQGSAFNIEDTQHSAPGFSSASR